MSNENENTAGNSSEGNSRKGKRGEQKKYWTCSALKIDGGSLTDLIQVECDGLIEMLPGNKKGQGQQLLKEAADNIVKSVTLIQEMVQANAVGEAEESFKAKHGVSPEKVSPPQRLVKMASESQAAAKAVTIEVKQRRFTGDQFEGIFEGWMLQLPGLRACEVNGRKYEDNELVFPLPGGAEPANPDADKPSPLRLKNMQALRLADIEIRTKNGEPFSEQAS